MTRQLASLVLALILGASPAFGAALPEAPLFPYEKQGPFVVYPARFVSAPVYQIGFVAGAVLCLPVSIVQEARARGRVPRSREASIVCGKGLGTAVGWPVYAAVGLPFFLLKGVFWDGPRALMHRGKRGPPAEKEPR